MCTIYKSMSKKFLKYFHFYGRTFVQRGAIISECKRVQEKCALNRISKRHGLEGHAKKFSLLIAVLKTSQSE